MPAERWKKIHIEGAKWRVNCLSISIILTYKNGGAEKAKGGRSAKSLVGKLAVAKIQSQL